MYASVPFQKGQEGLTTEVTYVIDIEHLIHHTMFPPELSSPFPLLSLPPGDYTRSLLSST